MLVALAFALGTYRVSYGSESRSLELRSGGRFVYTARGCFHRDVARGGFRVEGDGLLLTPPPEDDLGSDRYRIVPWGDSTLLVGGRPSSSRRGRPAGLARRGRRRQGLPAHRDS